MKPRWPWTEEEATPGRRDLRSRGTESESARCAGRRRLGVRGARSRLQFCHPPHSEAWGPMYLCEPQGLGLNGPPSEGCWEGGGVREG